MNITVIKMLIAIKNAIMLKKNSISITYNKLNHKLIRFLYHEGLIQSYTIIPNNKQNLHIKITLRYFLGISPLERIVFFSTPKKEIYLTLAEICALGYNKKILIFSTSKGFLTGTDCKRLGLGGKLYFVCG